MGGTCGGIRRQENEKNFVPGTGFRVYTFRMSMFSTLFAARSLPASQAAERELVRQENLAIAAGLRRQDPGLLDQLIVRHQHRLMRYLLYLTGNREESEDLFQEVWMRVLVRGGQYDAKARFDTWLLTIARNLVIDQRRKRTVQSLDAMIESAHNDEHSPEFELAADGPSPLEEYTGVEDRTRLAAAMMQLEPNYREVLVLRFHEELSLEEIASVTKSPLSTVKSRLYRGLALMKPALAKV